MRSGVTTYAVHPLSRRAALPTAVTAAAISGGLVVAWALVRDPQALRPVFAVLIGVDLLVCAARWPRTAAVATLAMLPALSLIRRLLIPAAGWSSLDPLLLVAPIIAIFLVLRLFAVERRRMGGDRISTLVLALCGLTFLQTLNPLNPGLAAGFGGLLFIGAPLLWFFIGREVADRRSVAWLMYVIICAAVPIGLYGLSQGQGDVPAWDVAWVKLNGYAALNVGGQIRAFGTFASAAEYARFLGVATVFAVVLLIRRPGAVIALPVAATALFLASVRTILVLTGAAVIVLAALRFARGWLTIVVVIVAVAGSAFVASRLGPAAGQRAPSSGNPLVAHQVGGLANPLDPEQSTLPAHWAQVVDAAREAIRQPLGRGAATGTIAAQKLGANAPRVDSEVDVTNMFLALGLPGGAIVLALMILIFRRVVGLYIQRRDPVLLAILGALIVGFGQWLNGGHYAMAPLTWFLIGWAAGLPAGYEPRPPFVSSKSS